MIQCAETLETTLDMVLRSAALTQALLRPEIPTSLFAAVNRDLSMPFSIYTHIINLTRIMQPKMQHQFDPYGYDPSLPGAIVATATFCILSLIHAYQALRSRTWYFFWFVLGGCCK